MLTPAINRNRFIVLFSLSAAVLTFPRVLQNYGQGADAAYVWAYNHLFVSDFAALKNLVFAYGPLGFLKFAQPIGHNESIALGFALLLRWVQAVFFLQALKACGEKLRVWHYLLLLLLLRITSFDLAFVSIMLCGGLLAEAHKKWQAWLPGILTAAVGLYIKFSIGAMSFALLGGYLVFGILFKKIALRQALWPILTAVLAVWAVGFALYGDLTYAGVYVLRALRISSAYSAALSLHPETDKTFLWTALLLLSAYPLLQYKSLKPALFAGLLAALFMVWKHSIVREEPWHIFLLVQALMMIWLYLIAFSLKKKALLLLPALLTMLALWRYTNELGGVRKFLETENTYTSFFRQQQRLTASVIPTVQATESLQYCLLPDDVRRHIGSRSIDIYPWDLNYAAVNSLNWTPRPGLQGIDFSPWLDRQNTDFFRGPQAPEFVLWHRNEDRFGRELAGFEERYLLSSEPLMLDALLENYRPVQATRAWTLFQKNKNASPKKYVYGETFHLRLGEMLAVPYSEGLVKADVHFDLTNRGKIQSALYKEPALFIRYTWKDGTACEYNILRHNTPSGIWVQPFLSSLFFPDYKRFIVDSIGFFSSNPELVSSNLSLTWKYAYRPSDFIRPADYIDTVYYQTTSHVNEPAEIPPFTFNRWFHIPVDSLPKASVEFRLSLKSEHPWKALPRIMLALGGDTLIAYDDNYLPAQKRRGNISMNRIFNLNKYNSDDTLNVYLWNEASVPYRASDAKLVLRSYPPDSMVSRFQYPR